MDGKVSEMEAVQKKNKYEIDMCNGTIMDKLISFALPLMADVSTSFVWILLLDAVLLLTGLWVPNLLAMMAVYAPVEKSLHLEAKIHDVQNR